MRHPVFAAIVAASLCAAAPRPAQAWGGGGFLFGTVLGLTTGAVVGSALAHPYVVAPPYPYPPPVYAYPPPAYPLAYGYPPAYPYPPPYPPPYAYSPPYGAPPSYGAPPRAPSSAGAAPGGQARADYAATRPAPALPASSPACRTGQFFNTLTGSCDRR